MLDALGTGRSGSGIRPRCGPQQWKAAGDQEADPSRVRELLGFTVNPLQVAVGVDWGSIGSRVDVISVWRRTNLVKQALSSLAKFDKVENPCAGKANVRTVSEVAACANYSMRVPVSTLLRYVTCAACAQRYVLKTLAAATSRKFKGLVVETHYEQAQLNVREAVQRVVHAVEHAHLTRDVKTRALSAVASTPLKKLTEDASELLPNFEELATALARVDAKHADATGCHLESMLSVKSPTVFASCNPTLLCERLHDQKGTRYSVDHPLPSKCKLDD